LPLLVAIYPPIFWLLQSHLYKYGKENKRPIKQHSSLSLRATLHFAPYSHKVAQQLLWGSLVALRSPIFCSFLAKHLIEANEVRYINFKIKTLNRINNDPQLKLLQNFPHYFLTKIIFFIQYSKLFTKALLFYILL
jgi:hypothetical protein